MEPLNPWWGLGVYLVATIASVVIRWPHDAREKTVKVADDRKGALERFLLVLVGVGFMVLPVLAMTPLLAFADYPLHPVALGAGALVDALGLWLFHRSHADLGTNWSITLQLREDHALVTRGIYAWIRHPMYSAIYCLAIGQALLIANAIAGPACFVTFTLMFALRVGPEEGMMREKFGDSYADYARRTKRLVPYLF
jgi:protein-S-isoprenylcysteine O-methyltransferase Ste14